MRQPLKVLAPKQVGISFFSSYPPLFVYFSPPFLQFWMQTTISAVKCLNYYNYSCKNKTMKLKSKKK